MVWTLVLCVCPGGEHMVLADHKLVCSSHEDSCTHGLRSIRKQDQVLACLFPWPPPPTLISLDTWARRKEPDGVIHSDATANILERCHYGQEVKNKDETALIVVGRQ
jgi:hypothetical protein